MLIAAVFIMSRIWPYYIHVTDRGYRKIGGVIIMWLNICQVERQRQTERERWGEEDCYIYVGVYVCHRESKRRGKREMDGDRQGF